MALCADAPFARNLLDEGVSPERVFTTGNTIVDALQHMDLSGEYDAPSLKDLPRARLIYGNAHRRENHGAPLSEIARAVATIARRFPDVVVVLPVHPNPNVRAMFELNLGQLGNVRLIEPVGYRDMLRLLKRSELILTDSGGIQEEAPSLGTPGLILRDVTERPELVTAGAGRLVGTHHDVIVQGECDCLRMRSPTAQWREHKIRSVMAWRPSALQTSSNCASAGELLQVAESRT